MRKGRTCTFLAANGYFLNENVSVSKQSDSVKQVRHSLNIQRIISWICASLQLYGDFHWVSAHCLAVWSITSLFWFSLIAVIVSFTAAAGSCFQRRSSKHPAHHQTADRESQTLAWEHGGAFGRVKREWILGLMDINRTPNECNVAW